MRRSVQGLLSDIRRMLFELVEAQALIDRIRTFNRSGHPIWCRIRW
jgi:hypothetical protein